MVYVWQRVVDEVFMTLLIVQFHDFGRGNPLTTHHTVLSIAVLVRNVVYSITGVLANTILDRVFRKQRGPFQVRLHRFCGGLR